METSKFLLSELEISYEVADMIREHTFSNLFICGVNDMSIEEDDDENEWLCVVHNNSFDKISLDYLDYSGNDIYDTEQYSFCDHCGCLVDTNETNLVRTGNGEEFWCETCSEEDAFICRCCEERYSNDIGNDTRDGMVCRRCFDNHYCYCEECEEYVHEDEFHGCVDDDDEVFLCDRCYNHRERSVVRSYHNNPPLRKQTVGGESTNLFIGCEIETCKGDYEERKEITKRYGNDEKFIYQMRDGSLDNYGIECITQPFSLEFWKQFDFEGWFKALVQAGARAHDTSCCGLHVHLSKEWFGNTTEEQELCAGVVTQIMGEFKRELQKFARRTDTSWCHYPDEYDFSYNRKLSNEEKKDIKKHNKCGKYGDSRYDCLNTQNCCTYEFRIFKGTLNPVTYRASVYLCIRLIDYAKKKIADNNTEYSWEEFINFKERETELQTYLEKRNLCA